MPFIESTEWPSFLIDKFKDLKINGAMSSNLKYGALGSNMLEGIVISTLVSKIDLNISTFIGVHWALGTAVIEHCGNDEQKDRMLPGCLNLTKICAFALTEPKYGSDATSLETFAVRATDGRDGWILNG